MLANLYEIKFQKEKLLLDFCCKWLKRSSIRVKMKTKEAVLFSEV